MIQRLQTNIVEYVKLEFYHEVFTFLGPLRALPNMLTYICYNMAEHVIIRAIIYILMCIS